MSSSAISTQVAQLKIGNVQNQADTSAVYNGGIWSFKNSTALTSVTITDAGAVTLGPSGFTGNHVVNGNVGIGTASPGAFLDIRPTTNTNTANFGKQSFTVIQTDATVNLLGDHADGSGPSIVFNHMNVSNGVSTGRGARIVGFRNAAGSDRSMGIDFKYADGNGTTQQGMRIDSSGQLIVGNSSLSSTTRHVIYGRGGAAEYGALEIKSVETGDEDRPAVRLFKTSSTSSTSQRFMTFLILNSVGSGQINANGSGAAAFGSYSDLRLKENIVPLAGELDKVLALNPVEFDFKDGSGHQVGFIAQEMEKIYPDAVNILGETEEMKTITGWDKTTARLVKAIQELSAKVDAQAAEIEALKAK